MRTFRSEMVTIRLTKDAVYHMRDILFHANTIGNVEIEKFAAKLYHKLCDIIEGYELQDRSA